MPEATTTQIARAREMLDTALGIVDYALSVVESRGSEPNELSVPQVAHLLTTDADHWHAAVEACHAPPSALEDPALRRLVKAMLNRLADA